jgi:hypothetical protein
MVLVLVDDQRFDGDVGRGVVGAGHASDEEEAVACPGERLRGSANGGAAYLDRRI